MNFFLAIDTTTVWGRPGWGRSRAEGGKGGRLGTFVIRSTIKINYKRNIAFPYFWDFLGSPNDEEV